MKKTCLVLCSLLGLLAGRVRADSKSGQGGGPTPDVILAWNQIMLDANAVDHTPGPSQSPEQGGPVKTARAMAIVSVAMFDAWNSVNRKYRPYLTELSGYESADERAAVATAACETLKALYPRQTTTFNAAHSDWLRKIPSGSKRAKGVELGQRVATAILAARASDGSNATMSYTPINLPGFHQVDPLHPGQGFLGPQWGYVTPFVISNPGSYVSPAPPALNSAAYTAAYNQVLTLGGDGLTTPTLRTPEQTIIGTFWGYDGSRGLGTPPRMYNQIIRIIANDKKNSVEQNARLFALANLAMADAGIQAWRTKYIYQVWRPVIGIRAASTDGNADTAEYPTWTPLGAPATNGTGDGVDFTPPFPAYTSGHATFGAASLWSVAKFYGTPNISFKFTSDEYNGLNRGSDGNLRPVVTRRYNTLNAAIDENAISRIYLGVHWSFDATEGVVAGKRIAEDIAAVALQPRKGPKK